MLHGLPAEGAHALADGLKPNTALDVLDRVYLRGRYPDPDYRARREALFLIAVNCTVPGGTCWSLKPSADDQV